IRTTESYRIVYKAYQKEILEREYSVKEFISPDDQNRIAKETGLDTKQVKIWFQNRRAKTRKEKGKI
ncbi:hypothetical protein HELRODRAFT_153685, partial [Helobdella robusta]|uniref:Homeobox domain-containing protein n=1 Tax=Helobdella robusta TaxID=6412 RepID=T1ELA9_HELRO